MKFLVRLIQNGLKVVGALLLLEGDVLDVEVDFRLLLKWDRVEAEPLEGLDLAFGVVHLVAVDVLRRKYAV